jgi:acyl-CoA thioester hydrolase
MSQFVQEVQVRWSDLDPNFHLRHSVYYDWGAFCRIEYFITQGLTTDVLARMNYGVILLREECIFRKEIRLHDKITIDLKLVKAKKDFSRWSIRHTIKKNGETIAAILTVEGAWIDLVKRKLTVPPIEAAEVFNKMQRGDDFQWLD